MTPTAVQGTPHKASNPLRSQLLFTLYSGLALLVMYTLLRVALLVYNRELIGDTPSAAFVEAFYNGLRFDLRVVVYACAPVSYTHLRAHET